MEASHDVIVVGTGPGGATVARELARRGKRVLMLERGPGKPVRGTFGQFLGEQLVPGKSLLATPDLVGVLRGLTVGGSTMFYYATAFPVPLEMLRRRGVDVAAEVAEAKAELRVAPLRDDMVTPMARRIFDAAREVGLDWQRLDKFIDQERWRPGTPFGYYGDPEGIRWSARAFVDEAVARGATLVAGARVERVIVEGGRATGVAYVERGSRRVASAPAVVLAAGGIGSPVVLRASGIPEAGVDYFFDPLVTVAGTMRDVRLRDDEIPLAGGVLLEDEGYMLADMAVPPGAHFIFSAQVLKLRRLFSFRDTARVMVKVRDALGGRLSRRGGVRKRLHPSDRYKLGAGLERARRILVAAGARDIYRSGYFAAHPGGTAKLGEVVDANLETRIEGLHVCDCSVIPEPWGMPPTLTLVALGKRLAHHLAAPAPPARVAALPARAEV
jgi:choline dehydrogenase-like flavoprotein